MKPQKVKIGDLVLDPANARKHSPRNIKAIAASLRRGLFAVFFANNARNVPLRYPVGGGYRSLGRSNLACLSDREHFRVCELSHWMIRSVIPVSVSIAVLSIFRQRIPAEIAKSVVRRHAIFVPAFRSVLSWADKCLKNKAVNPPGKRLAICAEANV
jgi:hypothetical protein